jgi:hypothetical protein
VQRVIIDTVAADRTKEKQGILERTGNECFRHVALKSDFQGRSMFSLLALLTKQFYAGVIQLE